MSDDFTHLLTRARTGDREALHCLAEQYEKKVRLVPASTLGRPCARTWTRKTCCNRSTAA